MRIAFTGSQQGMTAFQADELFNRLVALKCSELIHGDCIGSDEAANDIAVRAGVTIFTIYPGNLPFRRAYCFKIDYQSGYQEVNIEDNKIQVKLMREGKPLERNKLIVDSSEILIATPKEFTHTVRSGTWATIRYAWKKKKNVIIIPPVV